MKFTDFVKIESSRIGNVNEVFSIAKRYNNKKRDFLLVNKLLGKHVSAKGSDILEHFEHLYKEVAQKLSGKKVLVVGFAETATALSNHIFHRAVDSGDFDPVYYIQTTREIFPKKLKYISFEEEHSHATTQRLYLKDNIPEFDIVLFVEDEITTGKTIRNFVSVFEKKFPNANYAVASVLNLQTEENKFDDIETIFLVKGSILNSDLKVNIQEKNFVSKKTYGLDRTTFPFGPNPRKGLTREEYLRWWKTVDICKLDNYTSKDLIIGTEEMMYPAIKLASKLGACSKSTTRSPIAVSDEECYLFKGRTELISTYNTERVVNIYNVVNEPTYENEVVLVEDHTHPHTLSEYRELGWIPLLIGNKLVQSSLNWFNCTMLLQDLTGRVEVLDTEEREKRNQQGTHYSEMVAKEKAPNPEYEELYKNTLDKFGLRIVEDTANLAKEILKHTESPVIVSLARAGTPVGILLSEIFSCLYDISPPHYSISILRGKGVDYHALKAIVELHDAKDIVFVDGWTGKGAIAKELSDSIRVFEHKMKEEQGFVSGVNPGLAVVADPAGVAFISGTQEDYLIPNALLNATVSGLVSRTIKLKEMTDSELHGAIYYNNLETHDLSEKSLQKLLPLVFDVCDQESTSSHIADFRGVEEVQKIAELYNVSDINKVKPGIGETTRVLLRRVPDIVILSTTAPADYVEHIKYLCDKKGVAIDYMDLDVYHAIGIIKSVADL